LAPMQGVTDAPMRALQGATGAFTFAVSEFLRVGHTVPPEHVFARHVPELRTGGRTPTGLPVQVQLLGGDPGRLAEAAVLGHAPPSGGRQPVPTPCPARPAPSPVTGGAPLYYRLRSVPVPSSVPPAPPPPPMCRSRRNCG